MKKIILSLAVLLCMSCDEKKAPTLEEEILPSLIEQAKGEIDYNNSDIDATLLTIGSRSQGFGGTSASVAGRGSPPIDIKSSM